jgi:hypothetical protein
MSGLDNEIDRLIGLLADDKDQQVAQSAMFRLVGIGPAAFGQLEGAMYETDDDRLRVRTIEVLGLSCKSHPEAVSILVAAWWVLVEPCARGTIERALFATLLNLLLRHGVSQPEPKRRGGQRRHLAALRALATAWRLLPAANSKSPASPIAERAVGQPEASGEGAVIGAVADGDDLLGPDKQSLEPDRLVMFAGIEGDAPATKAPRGGAAVEARRAGRAGRDRHS